MIGMSSEKIEVVGKQESPYIEQNSRQDSDQESERLWQITTTGDTHGFINFPKLQRLNLLSIQHELLKFEDTAGENESLSLQERKELRVVLHQYGKTFDIIYRYDFIKLMNVPK